MARYRRLKKGNYVFSRKRGKPVTKPMVMKITKTINPKPTTRQASFAGVGFPLHLKMTHVWQNTYEVTCTNTLGAVSVNCIGMYQPDPFTPLTKQPMYFDQIEALYSNYNVIAAKCKFTIISQSITAQPPFKVVAWINENATGGITDFDALSEYKGAKTRISAPGLNPGNMTITQKWSTKKHNSGSVMSNYNLNGTGAANPLEAPRFQLSFRNINSGTSTSLFITAHVTYVAIWSQPKEINGS